MLVVPDDGAGLAVGLTMNRPDRDVLLDVSAYPVGPHEEHATDGLV